jgi:hypothetical protein
MDHHNGRGMHLRTLIVIPLSISGALLVACEPDNGGDVTSPTSQRESTLTQPTRLVITTASTSPTILVHNKNGGEDALIEGYVQYLDPLDCWVLVSTPGISFRHVLVWPIGADPAPVEDGGEVTGLTVDGTTIYVGDWLKARGGGREPGDVDAPDTPSQCFGETEPQSYQLVDEIIDVTQEPTTTSTPQPAEP